VIGLGLIIVLVVARTISAAMSSRSDRTGVVTEGGAAH
jgi:hypothetical protein